MQILDEYYEEQRWHVAIDMDQERDQPTVWRVYDPLDVIKGESERLEGDDVIFEITEDPGRDNERTVIDVVPIEEALAELSPEEKLFHIGLIRKYRGMANGQMVSVLAEDIGQAELLAPLTTRFTDSPLKYAKALYTKKRTTRVVIQTLEVMNLAS
ncbi:MAG: hypothetical protein AAFN65_12010 [Bacteroidota bacterium]